MKLLSVVKNFIYTILVIFGALFSFNCQSQPENFKFEDFKEVVKIDSHVHINADVPSFVEQALEDNFKLITINTDVPYYPSITDQRKLAATYRQKYPDRVSFTTTFSLDAWGKKEWLAYTIGYLDESFGMGSIAVKVWKNIGMEFKDDDGNLVMIDHPNFDPVFHYLTEKKIPVVGHLGEPRNCWLPVEEMTVNNDKQYFENHPEYHMYLHPDMPSYEDQIKARDNLLEKHSDLHFIGAHLGSLEWSVDELAKRFDRYPNFAVDMAARICHLQYQSSIDRKKVRDFLIKYQDRILYATDLQLEEGEPDDSLKQRMHKVWLNDWRYLVTNEWMSAPELNNKFQGLALPRKVAEKIYRQNAEHWYAWFF